MNYLIFDTETNGLPSNDAYKDHVHNVSNWPRMVELAWLLADENGTEIMSRSDIIRPDGFTFYESAVQIHGITESEAVDEGISIDEALFSFGLALEASGIMAGHNVNFDMKIVGAEFIRNNLEDRYQKIKKMDKICTMFKTTKLCKIRKPKGNGYKWPKLEELYTFLFGARPEGSHTAMGDVRATAKCLFKLLDEKMI